jgi:predicted RNA-binding Zn-ribbon protein involved in translation (DUF1610 family)
MNDTIKKKLLKEVLACFAVVAIVVVMTHWRNALSSPSNPNVPSIPNTPPIPIPNAPPIPVPNSPSIPNTPPVPVPNSVIIMNSSPSPNSPAAAEKIQLLCKNPICGYQFELSRQEAGQEIPIGPGMPIPVFKCPKCGQESAYIAITCEKCGNFFVLNYQNKIDFPDRCPKCGFSKSQETSKKNSE